MICMYGCTRLVEVPSYFQNLKNLTYLDLDGCENLKILGGIPCNIEVLQLRWTRIEQIPSSIWACEKLHSLDVSFCSDLKNLPSSNTCKLNVYGGDRKLLSKSFSSESCKLKRWPSSSSVTGRLFSLRNLDLGWCEVLEIPESLIGLPTLECINLSETMIESIPKSIKNASGLRTLCLIECMKLRSLPELPSQLQVLNVSGCRSLKSVASSRSPLMQHWEQYKGQTKGVFEMGSFTNCCGLDESSRNNILGDAQLRVMRMASSKLQRASLLVDCPGTEIPRWFGYQREGCEINIKVPELHDLHTTTQEYVYSRLGFALSVVVADLEFPQKDDHFSHHHFELVCECNFKTNNEDESYQRKLTSMVHVHRLQGFEEDHVVVFFNQDMLWPTGYTERSNLIPSTKVTEASFRFYVNYYRYNIGGDKVQCEEPRIEVKKCGFHFLYDDGIMDTSHTTWP